tara:strand:- start:62 stop:370 length:309 start_codon:yes stop_codon:yes gene_type:complete
MNWNLVHFRDDLQSVKADLRDFRKEAADRFFDFRKEMADQFGEVRKEFGKLRKESNDLRKELAERLERSEARTASQFRWTHGLILVSWLSLAGMILPLYFRQ